MSVTDPLNGIMSLNTIDELAAFIQPLPAVRVRHELLSQFDGLTEYCDANEWATAVRVCEALAIVGWGSRERVDAISRFNGDCWETLFIADSQELRFRYAYWSKRKAGWTIRNSRYYASPDFPQRPPTDWPSGLPVNLPSADATVPIVDRENLPSQRNYRLQMPITMGIYAGENETSKAATSLNRELRKHLLATMKPAEYGDAVEKFYFTFHCPASSETFDARLKIGAYSSKQKAFYSDVYFSEEFGQLSQADQRAFIGRHLLSAIDALATKLEARKIDYDVAAFRTHVEGALELWNQQGS